MASKKCPKCGEDNPAEAVMCWACYTPLSGAAMAGSPATGVAGKAPSGGPGVASLATEEAPAKKALDPKMIAVVAFLVIFGGIAYMVNSGMSKPPDDGPASGGDKKEEPTKAPEAPGAPAPPPLSVPPGPDNSPPPAAVPLPFTVITPPNPRYPTGTMGILVAPTAPVAGIARFAKNQYTRNGNWQTMQIFAFVDKPSADLWKAFQEPRRGARLDKAQYQQLATQGLWATTPVLLEASGKTERVHYPSKNPNSWWGGR